MTDAELRYIVDVNDRDLAVLVKRIKETNKALLQMGVTGETAGTRGSRGVTKLATSSARASREAATLDRRLLGVEKRLLGLGRHTATFVGLGALVSFGGVLAEAKSVVDATDDMQKAQAGLDAQLTVLGKNTDKYRDQIEGVVQAQAALAAIDDEEVKRSLTTLLRATGDVTAAEKLNALALDASAGTGKPLLSIAIALAKAWNGNTTSLKRLGIPLIQNVSTLKQLEGVQREFAGQAEKAGDTAGASFERFHIFVKNVKEEFGAGFLPGVASGFEELNREIASPEAIDRARHLGELVGHDLDRAVKDVIGFMHDHWGEIQNDFDDGKDAIVAAAHGAELMYTNLKKLADLVPAKNSLIELLVAGAIGRKILFGGKAGKAAAAAGEGGGGVAGLLEALGLGAVAKAGAKKASLSNPEVLAMLGIGIGGDKIRQKLGEEPIDHHMFTDFGFEKGPGLNFLLGHGWKSDQQRARDAAKANEQLTKSTDKAAHATTAADRAAAMYGTSLADLSGVIDTNSSKLANLKTQLTAQERSLRSATSGVSDALGNLVTDGFQVIDRQTQNMLSGFDNATDGMLTSFDDATQKMLDNLTVKVKIAGKNSTEAFTIKDGQKTPAERELDALDDLIARRSATRDTFDAKQALSDALALGDPDAIRQARRQVEDANIETRHNSVEKQAKVERAAADKQTKAAQDALTKRRNLQRKSLEDSRALQRQSLEDQKNAERDALQRTIDSLEKQIEDGRVKADVGVKKIVAKLREHGVDFKSAGDLLGQAFADTMQADLKVVDTRATAVAKAFERIGKTKAAIKTVREEVAKLVHELTVTKDSGNQLVPPGGTIPKHPVRKALGGTVPGSGDGDTVPAMLTPGEIVLNERQQRQLARKLGLKYAGPDSLFGSIQTFGKGGVVKKLREELARSSLKNFRARAAGKVQHPVHIEGLVKNALGHGDKALEQQLAQAQAHPVLSGLIDPRATATNPLGLGTRTIPTPGAIPRGTSGDVNYITIRVDGRGESDAELARKIAAEIEKRARRN